MSNSKRPTLTWESYARDIGNNIQRRRVERGYSQERVAYEARLSRYTYQKLEKGESRPGDPANPRLQTLLAIAQVLEIELTDLLPATAPDLAAR
ncbi:helix-turn-helix transcriptional regulator [Microbacterium hibisci]|uniref:helix-turn-helix transcriptional regulator n=1 Tax=Microbacterium hibisci TaxID=2036000 RepID=UPI0027D9D46F|nr:helix-turn-helix transcriptional regulator [Microbacterium hibisci]